MNKYVMYLSILLSSSFAYAMPLHITNTTNTAYFFMSNYQGYLAQPQESITVPCVQTAPLFVFCAHEGVFNLLCIMQAQYDSSQPIPLTTADIVGPMFDLVYGHLIKKIEPATYFTEQKKQRDALITQEVKAQQPSEKANQQKTSTQSVEELKKAMMQQVITSLKEKIAQQGNTQTQAATIKKKLTPSR